MLDRIASGEVRKVIAADMGCSVQTIYTSIHRHLKANGLKTVEQAVAQRVADRIKAQLSADLGASVDEVLKAIK